MNRKSAGRRPAPVQDDLVEQALRGADGPVSAYDIIDRLRDKATLAPQTVYRSLGRLIADGKAHRLESLNAFVACQHGGHESTAVFAICDGCKAVTEFHDDGAVASLEKAASRRNFAVTGITLELRGQCDACRTTPE